MKHKTFETFMLVLSIVMGGICGLTIGKLILLACGVEL